MPMMPEKVKYRKMHRGSRTGLAHRGEHGRLWRVRLAWPWNAAGWTPSRSRPRAWPSTRYMKRRGKVWIRIFPQKSFTKKPLETRMGKGKGPLESWVAVIRPANVLFEVDGVTEAVARESMRLAATKLPIKTKFISRHHMALSRFYENAEN